MQQAKYQDFANRLNELMQVKSSQVKTVNALKDAIGVTYEMARRYTLGTAKPRDEKLKVLADIFNVDVSYLDHGTTQIQSQIPNGQTQLQRDNQLLNEVEAQDIEFWDGRTKLDDDEFEVPFYKDIEFTGGAGSFEQHDDGRRKLKYGKASARKSGASQTHSICLTLVGDSMEDRIAAGSTIAIDRSKTEIREGKIYAFRHGQLLRVKYLIPRPDGGVIIRSHNKQYDDEIITATEAANDIEIIGWVWNWSVLERW